MMAWNPLMGILPQPHPRTDVETAEIVQQEQTRPGEVELDEVIRAQSLAPQVIKRITELENCLWLCAERLALFTDHDPAVERAKLLLRTTLEIPLT